MQSRPHCCLQGKAGLFITFCIAGRRETRSTAPLPQLRHTQEPLWVHSVPLREAMGLREQSPGGPPRRRGPDPAQPHGPGVRVCLDHPLAAQRSLPRTAPGRAEPTPQPGSAAGEASRFPPGAAEAQPRSLAVRLSELGIPPKTSCLYPSRDGRPKAAAPIKIRAGEPRV